MLRHGEINPLNVFGLRKLEHCPPHFDRVVFDIKVTEKKISDWVFENLDGRFWLGDVYVDKSAESPAMSKCVAFEHKSEASYFALCLDQLNAWEGNTF